MTGDRWQVSGGPTVWRPIGHQLVVGVGRGKIIHIVVGAALSTFYVLMWQKFKLPATRPYASLEA